MKIGLLASALGQAGFFSGKGLGSAMTLKEKAEFAMAAGFSTMELSCGPADMPGPPKDVALGSDSVKLLSHLPVSCLSFYENNISTDLDQRARINDVTAQVIRLAGEYGIPVVSTFIGICCGRSLDESFDEFEKVFEKLVRLAEDSNVKLAIENCTLLGMNPYGGPGTISSTPALWEEMFRRIPSRSFGLTYDPEHSVSMFMDPVACIDGFEDRIFHFHAKDGIVLQDVLNKNGIFEQLPHPAPFPGASYIKACIPGRGCVDWKALLSRLNKSGYDGALCVEHEDRDYMDTNEAIEEGYRLGLRTLQAVANECNIKLD